MPLLLLTQKRHLNILEMFVVEFAKHISVLSFGAANFYKPWSLLKCVSQSSAKEMVTMQNYHHMWICYMDVTGTIVRMLPLNYTFVMTSWPTHVVSMCAYHLFKHSHLLQRQILGLDSLGLCLWMRQFELTANEQPQPKSAVVLSSCCMEQLRNMV